MRSNESDVASNHAIALKYYQMIEDKVRSETALHCIEWYLFYTCNSVT